MVVIGPEYTTPARGGTERQSKADLSAKRRLALKNTDQLGKKFVDALDLTIQDLGVTYQDLESYYDNFALARAARNMNPQGEAVSSLNNAPGTTHGPFAIGRTFSA
jgi:hypothetical protein